LRENYANLQNKHLAKHGFDSLVDHRSNKEKGVENEAEKHFGAAAIKRWLTETKQKSRKSGKVRSRSRDQKSENVFHLTRNFKDYQNGYRKMY